MTSRDGWRIREIERKDLASINQWRQDRDVVKWLGSPYRFLSPEVDEAWFDAYFRTRANNVRLAIADDEIDKIAGMVNLTGIDWISRSAEFSIQIGEKSVWGKGVGKWAAAEILTHGFEDLGLNRIHLSVLTDNSRARKLYVDLGFREEGILRQALFKEGALLDVAIMGLLRGELIAG